MTAEERARECAAEVCRAVGARPNTSAVNIVQQAIEEAVAAERGRAARVADHTRQLLLVRAEEPLNAKYDLSYRQAYLNAAAELSDVAILIREGAVRT